MTEGVATGQCGSNPPGSTGAVSAMSASVPKRTRRPYPNMNDIVNAIIPFIAGLACDIPVDAAAAARDAAERKWQTTRLFEYLDGKRT